MLNSCILPCLTEPSLSKKRKLFCLFSNPSCATSIDGKKLIESVDAELQETAHRVFLNGGMFLNVIHLAGRKAEREKTILRVRDAMAEIDAIGVQVKDLDIGLLDFPCKVDGKIVLLCWKLGEKGITHWHGTE